MLCRPIDLLTRTSDAFTLRLVLVQSQQWIAPTPCTEWDVRALVNHVVGANRRYTMLLHGATLTRSTPPAPPTTWATTRLHRSPQPRPSCAPPSVSQVR